MSVAVLMRERVTPSRPYSLGTRRRRPRAGGASAVGASRNREAGAPSLDTDKQLATSVKEWTQSQETELDRYKSRLRLWRQLLATVHSIWQDAAAQPRDEAELEWWNAYERERNLIKLDQNPAYDLWLEARVKKHGLSNVPEAYLTAVYLDEWRKKNKAVGRNALVLKWEKQYFQLLNCQGEWIGYRAECCTDRTQPIAMPIGCNHRLCPLCNWNRSRKAQKRCASLFDRLTHPQFITLTTPNLKSISKGKIHLYRMRVRQFLKQQGKMFLGGVYAIETTYNRTEKSWHIHAHVLVDASFTLPAQDQRVEFAGRNMRAFDFVKLALEYDWTRLWVQTLGKTPRKNAKQMALNGERFNFEQWVIEGRLNSLLEYSQKARGYVPISGLSEVERARRTAWNIANRRIIWIKPVTDREKAAKEVLKYITKCADFCDLPECVQQFYDATKSARLIQTFGTWYGVDLDTKADAERAESWSELRCTCGDNWWVRMGTFQKHDVRMDADGRYRLIRSFDHSSAGTVPRPTIRALDERVIPEDFDYGNSSYERAAGTPIYSVRNG